MLGIDNFHQLITLYSGSIANLVNQAFCKKICIEGLMILKYKRCHSITVDLYG
jgi:hypothetical protein